MKDGERKFVEQRLEALRLFAAGVDAAIEAFGQGHAVAPDLMRGQPARDRKKR